MRDSVKRDEPEPQPDGWTPEHERRLTRVELLVKLLLVVTFVPKLGITPEAPDLTEAVLHALFSFLP